MAEVEGAETPTGPTEPQSRHVVYCGGKFHSYVPLPRRHLLADVVPGNSLLITSGGMQSMLNILGEHRLRTM